MHVCFNHLFVRVLPLEVLAWDRHTNMTRLKWLMRLLNVPDGDYCRHSSCALNYISTFTKGNKFHENRIKNVLTLFFKSFFIWNNIGNISGAEWFLTHDSHDFWPTLSWFFNHASHDFWPMTLSWFWLMTLSWFLLFTGGKISIRLSVSGAAQ